MLVWEKEEQKWQVLLLWSIHDDCLQSDLFPHQPQPILYTEAKEKILKCILNSTLLLKTP